MSFMLFMVLIRKHLKLYDIEQGLAFPDKF